MLSKDCWRFTSKPTAFGCRLGLKVPGRVAVGSTFLVLWGLTGYELTWHPQAEIVLPNIPLKYLVFTHSLTHYIILVYIVVALSLERYISVVFPLHFRIWNSPERAKKAILIAYIVPLLFYIPYGIGRYSTLQLMSDGVIVYMVNV